MARIDQPSGRGRRFQTKTLLAGGAFLLIAGLPYLTMLTAGRPSAEGGSANAESISILSPHRREVRLEYSRGFGETMKQQHGRNVTIEWLDVGGTSKILKDLESRFATSPDNPRVDLFFGGGVAAFQTASQKGWLQPVRLPVELMEGIPPQCAGIPVYDTNGVWYGVALSGFGIIYNRVLSDRMRLPAPATWEDLAAPAYLGWLASGDPRSSGSVYKCYEIILQAYGFEKGWALITRICANVRRFGESGGVAPREVAAGEVAAGMVIDQYAQTVIDSVGRDALRFTLPAGVTVVDADPIAMLKGAPHPDLAQRFMEYALSAEGQRILFQPAGTGGQRYALHRMPVRKHLYDEPGAPAGRPYEYRSTFKYSEATERRRADTVKDLIGVWLIDAHTDLVAAWKAVIRDGMTEARLKELAAPPISEEELSGLAAAWKDSRRREDTKGLWGAEAKKRYQKIAQHD